MWTAFGLFVGALAAAALLRDRPQSSVTSSANSVRRSTMTVVEGGRLAFGSALPGQNAHQTLAFSPDGSHLVYVAERRGTRQLYLRSMDRFEAATPIAGTEGAFLPFFSPDGQWIAFFTPDTLKKVYARGGEVLTICDANRIFGATWADDAILFASDEGGSLARVSANGGTPQILFRQRRGFYYPQVLPGGQAILVTSVPIRRPQIDLLILATGERRLLIEGAADARYLPTGHLAFVRRGDLLAVPFDLDRLDLDGPEQPVLHGVRTELPGAGQFAVGADGTLAYVPGNFAGKSEFVWVNRRGDVEPLGVPVQDYGHFDVSPDGRRIAAEITTTKTDIYINDFSEPGWVRLTTEGNNVNPVWSPDGARIAFASDRDGLPVRLFWQSARGAAPAELLLADKRARLPMAWSPDGRILSLVDYDPEVGDFNTSLLPIDEPRKVQPLFSTQYNVHALFSPDGRWITYASSESGRREVYVRPYPLTNDRWQVSREGGDKPTWSPTGHELFYLNGSKYMVVGIVRRPGFAHGTPEVFAEGPYLIVAGRSYAVDRTGRRLLLLREVDLATGSEIRVVFNWFGELRAPAARSGTQN